jgi:hypothetical protein
MDLAQHDFEPDAEWPEVINEEIDVDPARRRWRRNGPRVEEGERPALR